jgi:predicted transcriptional regulator
MKEKTVQTTRRGRRPRLAGTVSVHVPLPKEHYLALDALAAIDRTSIAHHIRRAVAEYIEREKPVKWE